MRKFYAVYKKYGGSFEGNEYGKIYAFNSKKSRDGWVNKTNDAAGCIIAKPITSRERFLIVPID